MPSESHQPQRDAGVKRKAWLAVFALSVLFWIVVGVIVWSVWG